MPFRCQPFANYLQQHQTFFNWRSTSCIFYDVECFTCQWWGKSDHHFIKRQLGMMREAGGARGRKSRGVVTAGRKVYTINCLIPGFAPVARQTPRLHHTLTSYSLSPLNTHIFLIAVPWCCSDRKLLTYLRFVSFNSRKRGFSRRGVEIDGWWRGGGRSEPFHFHSHLRQKRQQRPLFSYKKNEAGVGTIKRWVWRMVLHAIIYVVIFRVKAML